jgi:hypothetical protein
MSRLVIVIDNDNGPEGATWIQLSQDRIRWKAEHGTQPMVSEKGEELLDQLSEC